MKNRLLWISLALNALGALTALALLAYGREIGRAVLLQPARERRESFFATNPVQPGDVVFLGDSLTDEARWEELFAGLAVRNRGVPGDTTADVLARLEPIARAEPAQVFLMIGTNDLGFGANRGLGWSGLDPFPGHGVLDVIVNAALNAAAQGWDYTKPFKTGVLQT